MSPFVELKQEAGTILIFIVYIYRESKIKMIQMRNSYVLKLGFAVFFLVYYYVCIIFI